MKLTYVYLKTHNKTKLKYFGITTKKDPHKYKGSGVYWRNHLKKHGSDISTEILGEFEDLISLKLFVHQFSKDNNITKSNLYANMKDETGDNTGWDYVNNMTDEEWKEKGYKERNCGWKIAKERNKGFFDSNQQKINGSKGGIKAKELGVGIFSKESKLKVIAAAKSLEVRKKHSDTAKRTRCYDGCKNSQYNTKWIHYKDLKVAFRIKYDLIENYLSQGWEIGSYSLEFSKNGKNNRLSSTIL